MPDTTTNTPNKVQFNLKNVHYAVISAEGSSTTNPTYGTAAAVPGAVSLTLDPVGEVNEFFADGIKYYVSQGNNGYEGDLEMALFPDTMLTAVWDYDLNSTSNVITESVTDEAKAFALMFQIDGDKNETLYCLYNCKGTRPAIASQTNTNSKEPQTQTSTITASPLPNGVIMRKTTADTTASIVSGWMTAPYQPT